MKRTLRPLEQAQGSRERRSHVVLLTEREAAERCRYFDRGIAKPLEAFQRWARRKGIPVTRIGRRRHYDPRILQAFLDNEGWTRRHRGAA